MNLLGLVKSKLYNFGSEFGALREITLFVIFQLGPSVGLGRKLTDPKQVDVYYRF